jgi:hypothetical protein
VRIGVVSWMSLTIEECNNEIDGQYCLSFIHMGNWISVLVLLDLVLEMLVIDS